jgi:hypothetical protein
MPPISFAPRVIHLNHQILGQFLRSIASQRIEIKLTPVIGRGLFNTEHCSQA